MRLSAHPYCRRPTFTLPHRSSWRRLFPSGSIRSCPQSNPSRTVPHREALANLEYGVSHGKPVTLLTGEPGTGKSTLLRAAMRSDACRHVRWVYIANPALTRDEFVTLLADEFHLSSRAASSKGALLAELRHTLAERRVAGEAFALVIDEAQAMSLGLLEEVRLLGNLENEMDRLLPIVLAGQPEFVNVLAQPALLPLRQRIALRCTVGPFDVAETASYIASRLRTAGGDASRVFTRDAVILIHDLSKGIARTINVVCDNALITGLALGRRRGQRRGDGGGSRSSTMSGDDRAVSPPPVPFVSSSSSSSTSSPPGGTLTSSPSRRTRVR